MSEKRDTWEEAAEWYGLGVDLEAVEVADEGQDDLVFRSFRQACEWSRDNAGGAFTRCDNGVDYRPIRGCEAYVARQSWHDFEELYIDGPYKNEMS